MSNINSIKDPSVKVNYNWGHNRPIISSTPGEFAYLSPLIREVCVQCKDLNVYIMELLNNMKNDSLQYTRLSELNAYHPEILQRVIYNQDIYNSLIERLPKLCDHYKRDGNCDVEGCNHNPSNKNNT